MALYGFIGETRETQEVRGGRTITFRQPPLLIKGTKAVWLAPEPGLDVWAGIVRCDTQAEIDALKQAATDAGLRLHLMNYTDNTDGTTPRPIGILARAAIRLMLAARGMADVDFTADDDERNIFDVIACRISTSNAHGRIHLLNMATRNRIHL